MNLSDRINNRRELPTNVAPIVERRADDERRATPRWMEWTRQNESRGKSLDGRAA